MAVRDTDALFEGTVGRTWFCLDIISLRTDKAQDEDDPEVDASDLISANMTGGDDDGTELVNE